ncbi:hypothetical protein LF1_20120 [Rubripirellula obstinata]|uniref:Uncharacterized protein n=1 Tax=Rubripirellula obstinata TaxID=406547 RepID=A0A5B1CEA0_9BACT|nr:hypothetical protein LF1_20120 [Rubripirellula obstinata]
MLVDKPNVGRQQDAFRGAVLAVSLVISQNSGESFPASNQAQALNSDRQKSHPENAVSNTGAGTLIGSRSVGRFGRSEIRQGSIVPCPHPSNPTHPRGRSILMISASSILTQA